GFSVVAFNPGGVHELPRSLQSTFVMCAGGGGGLFDGAAANTEAVAATVTSAPAALLRINLFTRFMVRGTPFEHYPTSMIPGEHPGRFPPKGGGSVLSGPLSPSSRDRSRGRSG